MYLCCSKAAVVYNAFGGDGPEVEANRGPGHLRLDRVRIGWPPDQLPRVDHALEQDLHHIEIEASVEVGVAYF